MNDKKQQYQHKLLKIKTLKEEITMLEKGLENDKEELQERQQDREFIMKFIRQVNPSKIQPTQKKKII